MLNKAVPLVYLIHICIHVYIHTYMQTCP